MSSARGAAGAVKPKLHNVNSIYAGKNQNAVKAPGLGKHGGLQSLGKTTAVVRRMPPPATLPSLRAESQGQDPNIALVPQGGTGWAKGDANKTNGSNTESQTKLASNTAGSATAVSTGISSSGATTVHTTDLRPTWAKQGNVLDGQTGAAQQKMNAVTASTRDFPSLAAATAVAHGKQTNALTNDSLKPQKSGSWRSGGSSATSKAERDEPPASIPNHLGPSFPSATAPSRVMDRQLPSRYYDTSTVPPPPPSGTFQVPKLQPTASLSAHSSCETTESLQSTEGGNGATTTSSVSHFPSNVVVPPPDYTYPPPNYVLPEHARNASSYGAHSLSSEEDKDGKQKSGPRDGDRNHRYLFGETCGGLSGGPQYSNDVRNMGYVRKDAFNSRGGIDYEQFTLHAENDWQGSPYGGEREMEAHRWQRISSGNGQEPSRYAHDFVQNGYTRDRDDEMERRQTLEREAAIERSRQKRRVTSQSSAISESESSSAVSGCCSGRMPPAYENDLYTNWDQTSGNSQNQQKMNERTLGQTRTQSQRWNTADERRIGMRNEQRDSAPKTEFRVLKRPETKEIEQLSQQLSKLVNDDGHEDDEELQLTKLSRPTTKIIKRVAPGNGSETDTAENQQAVQATSGNKTVTRRSSLVKSAEKRTNETRSQQFQLEKNENAAANIWGTQKQKTQMHGGNPAEQLQTSDGPTNAEPLRPSQAVPQLLVAPPPTDNVWEKRAEERESAERERAARDAQLRPQLQQVTTVGEQAFVSNGTPNNEMSSRGKEYGKNEQHSRRQGNRNRNRWPEKRYGGSYNSNDMSMGYYGKEDEDEDGGSGRMFRGQREFVNSRVHRGGRGSSLSNSRGGRGHGRSGYMGSRRGSSMPHQHSGSQGHRLTSRYSDRNQRRTRRQEPQEDNFSNMGEFRVEDAYVEAQRESTIEEKVVVEASDVAQNNENVQSASSETNKDRQQTRSRHSASHRSAQPLYEPRKRHEYNRSGRRGGRAATLGRGATQRDGNSRLNAAYQNASERGKRRKPTTTGGGPTEDGQTRSTRADSYRRGGMRGGQHNMRRRRMSPSQQGQLNANGGDRVAQLKSPVASEGHEEWETASENSDFVERQNMQRRTNAPQKYSNTRRVMRSGQRRDGSATNRATTNSKNAKPASTTSHVAARGATKEDPGTQTGDLGRREACKDGLAGVDINNAGVVVIDDRPDGQMDDGNENNDDFEEVLSKKSKKLRQQQINEQLEAEERRKLKEKEKIERRKARVQMKRTEKKTLKEERSASAANEAEVTKTGAVGTGALETKTDIGPGLVRTTPANTQNALNTTVWNSSIVREQAIRASPPIESRPVIPSPIARPTPKTCTATSAPKSDPWTGTKDEQGLHLTDKLTDSTSAKKSSVEFAANYNTSSRENGQYEFKFDPALHDDDHTLTQKPSSSDTLQGGDNLVTNEKPDLSNVALGTEDECLKQRFDKIKDFWPGQQTFSNNLLVSEATNDATIPSLVSDKNVTSTVVATVSHGPNVAKVRPQPQSSEQSTVSAVSASLKDVTVASSTPSTQILPPPSPLTCLPPGAYYPSLSQVPPPAPFSHYSMIFNETYNPNSSATSPAQTLFGTGIAVSQTQPTRSRLGSFIEQSQLFIRPPPPSAAANNLTWSNSTAQIEYFAGAISATPSMTTQPVNSLQRFQVNSPRSASTFGPLPAVLGSNGKMAPLGPPPPHGHQVPPPLPPHNFMAPPPDIISIQGTNLGAVGSQRSTDLQNSNANTLARGAAGVIGQIPPPHMQQQALNLTQQSQNGYTVSRAAAFSQAPPIAFTAPPPPIRFSGVPQMSTNDAKGMIAAGWPRPVVPSFKYASNNLTPLANRSLLTRSQPMDRWNTQISGMPSNFPKTQSFQGHTNAPQGPVPEESARESSVSSVSAPGGDVTDGGSQQKKAAKV